jgi:hypothetical protein
MARYTAFEEALGHLGLCWTDDHQEFQQGQWVQRFLDREAQRWYERASLATDAATTKSSTAPDRRHALLNDGRDNCASCGRLISTYVPKGGDGSERHAMTHNRAYGMPCEGSKEPTRAFSRHDY